MDGLQRQSLPGWNSDVSPRNQDGQSESAKRCYKWEPSNSWPKPRSQRSTTHNTKKATKEYNTQHKEGNQGVQYTTQRRQPRSTIHNTKKATKEASGLAMSLTARVRMASSLPIDVSEAAIHTEETYSILDLTKLGVVLLLHLEFIDIGSNFSFRVLHTECCPFLAHVSSRGGHCLEFPAMAFR